jgi:hypothetical protein
MHVEHTAHHVLGLRILLMGLDVPAISVGRHWPGKEPRARAGVLARENNYSLKSSFIEQSRVYFSGRRHAMDCSNKRRDTIGLQARIARTRQAKREGVASPRRKTNRCSGIGGTEGNDTRYAG